MAEQKNLEIEKITPPKISKQEEDTPSFKTKIGLSDDDKKRIFKIIKAEIEEIDKEQAEMNLIEDLETLDQQYRGEMREIPNMQFNVSRKTTSIKVNAIVRALMDALFSGDHVFTATPRPDANLQDPIGTAERQEDFLDYKIDEIIPLEETMSKVAYAAVLKRGGILKLTHKYKIKKRKTDEEYDGEWTEVLDSNGRMQTGPDGLPLKENKGLEAFLTAYPAAEEEFPQYVKQLNDGKKITITVEYDEVVYDDPFPQFVDQKNFKVRKNVDGIDGLRDTFLTAEIKEFTYWELLQEEKEERLYKIDDLTYEAGTDDKPGARIENYMAETYELLEIVMYCKIKEDDEEFVRCIFHVSMDKESWHSDDYYHYWGVDSYYIPFYINDRETGFYKQGVGDEIRDLHLAQNVLLNTGLEGAYLSSLITPIVQEGSPIAEQMIEKTWTQGDPFIVRSKADMPDFMNKYFRPPNIMELMNVGQLLGQEAGDAVGVSDAFATGKADPMDPSAPAQKTRDLLQQSGINIKGFIKVFGRGFNEVGNVLMQQYYQRNQISLKYRRTRQYENEYKEITRADMAAKTNYQTQALVFDIDKLNAKKEDLALWQVIRGEPLFADNEEAVYATLKTLIKGWSPKWRHNIDKVLPNLKEFRMKRVQLVMQVVQMFVKQTMDQAQVTGQPPKFDVKALMQMASQSIKEMATPPPKEVVKEREKAAKEQAA